MCNVLRVAPPPSPSSRKIQKIQQNSQENHQETWTPHPLKIVCNVPHFT